MSLYDLHVLTSKTDENTSFWQTISRFFEFQELSDHAKLNLERFTGIMKQSLKSLLFNSLRNVVENAWISLKGYLFTQKTDIKYVKDFFNLLDEIQIINKKTKNFLQENMKHLYAKPDFNTEKQLQIMTIHKAKGLEFDTVIVPGLNRKPKPQKNSLLMWTERLDSFNRSSNIILAPIQSTRENHDYLYNYLQFEENKKNYYETGRLFYVAVTRAKKNLHLLADIEKLNSGSLLEQFYEEFKKISSSNEKL